MSSVACRQPARAGFRPTSTGGGKPAGDCEREGGVARRRATVLKIDPGLLKLNGKVLVQVWLKDASEAVLQQLKSMGSRDHGEASVDEDGDGSHGCFTA